MQPKRLASLAVCLLILLITSLPSAAAPPVITYPIVAPLTLEIGSGMQTVTVSVRISDPDGDLTDVTVTNRFKNGTKEEVPLLDDGHGVDRFRGNGRFTGQIDIDTSTSQNVYLEVKAQDMTENVATAGNVVAVIDPAVSPFVVELDVFPSILHEATGLQDVTFTTTIIDPNLDLKKVKLELLKNPGQPERADDGKLGKLVNDGTGADAVAGDDAYSIQLEIDTARADLIPFKIRVQDAAGHRVDREYDLVIKPAQ